jgi:hypothetical protein
MSIEPFPGRGHGGPALATEQRGFQVGKMFLFAASRYGAASEEESCGE